MINEEIDNIIKEIKAYVTNELPISTITNEDLEEKIEEKVLEKTKDMFIAVEDKVSIAKRIFSSIRGFGDRKSVV